MAEDIKNLIEKIQQEGIRVAQDKAKDIEEKARRQADALIQQAEKQAQGLIREAQEEIGRMEKSAQASLEQVGRDLFLSLREEINAMLNRLIVSQLRQALRPCELVNIITTLIKNSSAQKQDVVVALNKKDLEEIKKRFLGNLRELTRKGITLKTSADIHGGFVISYDSAKSHYDFTDKALAQYLGLQLKPKLSQMLQRVACGGKKAQKR